MNDTSGTICRVCGAEFTPVRFDAVTCSDRCRKAKQRGHDLAYAADFSAADLRVMRNYHKAQAASIAAQRKARASVRKLAALRREQRLKRLRAAIRRELVAEVSRDVIREIMRLESRPDPKIEQRQRGVVAGAVKLLTSKGEPCDAAAIAAFLKLDQAEVEKTLVQLKDLGWRAPD